MRSRSRARKTLLRSCCYTIQIFQSEKYDDLKHTFLPTYTWLKETLKLCSNISITLWSPNVNIFLVPNFIRSHPQYPHELTATFALRRRCRACKTDEVCRRRIKVWFARRQGRRPLQYALITCVCLSLPLTREVRGFSRDGGREKGSK